MRRINEIFPLYQNKCCVLYTYQSMPEFGMGNNEHPPSDISLTANVAVGEEQKWNGTSECLHLFTKWAGELQLSEHDVT